MREVRITVDEFAWISMELIVDGKSTDFKHIPNFEKDESLDKSLKLEEELKKINEILCCVPYDKLTVECAYPPYSADVIRNFVTHKEKK